MPGEPETFSQWRADRGAVLVPWVRHLGGIVFAFLESWSSQFTLALATAVTEEVRSGGGVRNCGVALH